ncbi:MAG: hypothetical protein HYZ29_24565 [Myxococcales bacterium]|nr:hypothetical protein [Myxococcales bacterium]
MRWVALAFVLVLGCDGTKHEGDTGGSGGVAGAGGTAGIGGTAGVGGTAATGGTAGASGCEPAEANPAPGQPLTQPTDGGGAACAGVSVAQFLAKIHAAHPELADIKAIFEPGLMYDGSFVYPFRKPDGGFAFVLKRGGGDCPAGCTENEYWYFESDASCAAKDAGHFKPTYGAGCLNTEGTARWGRPPTPDPASICGADLAPQDISGSVALLACGSRLACSLDKPSPETLATTLTVTIAQASGDLSKGTVTVSGTGYAAVDGVAFPATFQRKRFAVAFHQDNLPTTCPKSLDVNLQYDFEGFSPQSLSADEVDTPDCSSQSYCKGGVWAKLFTKGK